MADVVKQEETRELSGVTDPWIPRAINSLLLTLSLSSLSVGVLAVAEKDFKQAELPLTVSIVTALTADYANCLTRSGVALFKMVKDAENRLAARQIQIQEVTTAADMGVVESRKLTELNLDEAVTQSEASIYLAELEAKHADAISRLQEFMEVEE